MDWLSQNWSWIALAVGGMFLVTRMGGSLGGGCCGMGRSMNQNQGSGDSSPPARGTGPGTAFDPVSRSALPAGAVISTVYEGRAYYFESRENRDTFECNPEKYLTGSPVVGQAIGSEGASIDRTQRRHGCG